MSIPTEQEVLAQQGTRLSDKAPWETYGDELDVKMTPELAAAVAEYAENRWEDSKNTQMQEELCRQKEMSEETSKEYQWINPEEYKDSTARIGKVISHAEFITTLRKAGIRCWYTQHPHPDKAVLYVYRDELAPPELACWVQIGQMPELSMMNFDEHGIPLAERRRGWRTCLLQLILKGIISEEKANKVFGPPKVTKQYDRYNSTLQHFRNAGSSLGE